MKYQTIKRQSLLWLVILLSISLFEGCSTFHYFHSKLTLFDEDYVVDNFRHMNQIFPSREIKASDTPLVLKKSEQPIRTYYTCDGEIRDLKEFLNRSRTTGFLVIKDGTIIHEKYFEGYGSDDKTTSFSMAKSFIATLVGIALDEGRIKSVNDPISDYVEDLKNTGFDGVPIVAVLQMSSGVNFTEDYKDKSTDAFTIYNDMYLFMNPITSIIRKYERTEAYGVTFHYASINTQALGMLVQAVYQGKSISWVLQEKLWRPIGAEKDASWLLDQHGNEVSFWGLNATLKDFAKLGLLYLNNGQLNGRRIISENWIKKSVNPDKPYLQPGRIDNDWGYQYHWWVPRLSEGDYAAIGIWGQFIYVNPRAGIVIVKTSADKAFKQHEYEAITAFRSIAEEFL